MRVLFLTQSTQLGPSSRYRVYQLIPALTKLGLDCTVSPAMDDATYTAIYRQGGGTMAKARALRQAWKIRHADLQRLDQFDAVVIQKGILPGILAIECEFAARKPTVFDFDDAIYLPRFGGNRILQFLHSEHKFQKVLTAVTHVTAGNSVLAAYARRFNPNVTIVPSSIELTRYPQCSRQDLRLPTEHRKTADSTDSTDRSIQMPTPPDPRPSASSAVNPISAHRHTGTQEHRHSCAVPGWIGSASTLPYLKPLKPVFERLQVNPIVIAAGDPSNLGYPVDFRQWAIESEMANLRDIGIGLAPLPDTPWENGKCGVKLLQYMACGIPAVASPVGVHKDIIEHGVNGYLATSTEQWIQYLTQLIQNPEMRQRMGSAARRTVEERYSANHAAALLAEAIRRATATHER